MLCLLVPPVCFRFHSFAYLYFSIRYVIFFIHFSTVLLDSRLGFNSSEIFLHAVRALCFLTIRGFRPIIGPAVFALLVTTSRPLLSFFLCCHLCCCFHHCYCFPHLESKRAKETCFHACKGRKLSCRRLFTTELVPVAGSRVGVIGISKKLPLVFRVSIVKTIERRVRWTGKK